MNFFTRNKILKNVNSADLIPVRICGHREEDGRVVVLVPKFDNRLMNLFFPASAMMFFHVKLDDQGSRVWNCICGQKTISEIEQVFNGTIREDTSMVEENMQRVLTFMRMLYDRRCISFRQIL